MARIRYLKPDFFKDDDLATLPFEVRLFFAGLWNFADKAGRLEDRPIRLKAEIFPYDDVDVENCLDLLSKPKNGSGKPFIQRYKVSDEKYIQIINWEKHQKPHHTEKDSILPPLKKESNKERNKIKIKGMEKGMEKQDEGSTELRNGEVTVKEPFLYATIISYLNEKAKTSYKATTQKTIELIKTRLKEGFTLEDFFTVIDKKVSAWGSDPKMCKFLRPETLFGTKFEGYLNEKMSEKFSGIKTWLREGEVEDGKEG